MGIITKIQKKIPKETALPDGTYSGTWGGSCITVHYNGDTYELTTKEGVRGFGYKVVVSIVDGKGTFSELNN